MWKRLSGLFEGLPAQQAVAGKMVELGLCIRADGKICCGQVEVKDASLAQAAGVDRRAVRLTVAGIRSDKLLREVFSKLKPSGVLLTDVAPLLGFGVVELSSDGRRSGIVAAATGLLARRRIVLRQLYAKDPDLSPSPTLVLITEKRIPGSLVEQFSKIPGVRHVTLY